MAKAQVFNFLIPRFPFRKRNAFSFNDGKPATIPEDETQPKLFSTEPKPDHVAIELPEDDVPTSPRLTSNSNSSQSSSLSLPILFNESKLSVPSSAAGGSSRKNSAKHKKKASFAAPAFTNLGFQGDSESTLCPSESSSEDDTWTRNNPVSSPDTGISSAGALNDSDSSGIFITNKPGEDSVQSTWQGESPATQNNEEDVVFPLPASRFGWNVPAGHQNRTLSMPCSLLNLNSLSPECSRSTGNLSVLNKSLSESQLRLMERNTRRAYSRQLGAWADKERMTRSATDLTCSCNTCDVKTSTPRRNASLISFSKGAESYSRPPRSCDDLFDTSMDSRASISTCVELTKTDRLSVRPSAGGCVKYGASAPIYQRRYKRARSAPPRHYGGSPPRHNGARWVGVHHDPHNDGSSNRASTGDVLPGGENGSLSCGSPYNTVSSLPSSPITPHIVVSLDEDPPARGEDFQEVGQDLPAEDGNLSCPLAKSKSLGSCEDLGGSKSDLSGRMLSDRSQMARHNSISSYLMPEIEMSMQRKTRRNSMLGMMQRASSVNNISLTAAPAQLMRVPSTGTLRHGASKTSLAPSNCDWRREGNDSMISCLSALYGKILVVMGLAFPIGEFISGEMPLYIFKGFYLYLHLGSIIFLVYAYMFLLHVVPLPKVEIKSRLQNLKASTADLARQLSASLNIIPQEDSGKGDVERVNGAGRNDDARSTNTITTFQNNKNYTITESTHESMYLKMGAMVFGIGSMIYSGLEVGQYFDLKSTPECADLLLVVSPVSRMLFTFIQMYFIFLNSRVAINKHRTVARFGLMHMIATNLCIWLNVLVEETKHEIHSLTHVSHGGANKHVIEDDELYGHGLATVMTQIADAAKNLSASMATTLAPAHNLSAVLSGGHHDDHFFDDDDDMHSFEMDSSEHHLVRRAAEAHHTTSIYDCRKSDMMSRLVDNASPFLFPCTIEYSLLCSGVLYVIWKNINKSQSGQTGNCGDSDISTFIARKARHHYSVDCAHATRGLFMGILVLVLTIISLILFFVLINNENTKSVAILEANIIELSVYSVAIITVVIGMVQMRELEFVEHGDIELDNILLLIAQTGTYIYTSFTIIGGNFSLDSQRILPFFTAVITLIQTTLQTLFILNASRRCCYTYDQLNRKPGREMVTFLLICNLAMWAISTFETSRADAHPTLLNYYGVWAWTIISHVSMPLAIFYRFHVTVCLCEIWKRSYKLKHDFL